MDRIALISDVHGNLTALHAVLADIEARSITRILNLGDYVGKGPRGQAVVDVCAKACEVNVRGNWDDFLPARTYVPSEGMEWWRAELRSDQLEWLGSRPLSHNLLMSGRNVRLFHASATSVHTRVHLDHTPEEFDGMFATTELTGDGPPPAVVGYGDIHQAFLEERRERVLFNAGSVGNALDEPTACYVILDGALGSPEAAPFSIQIVRVPYDVEAEIAVARELGMPEVEFYAVELREALYRGHQRAAAAP